MSKELRVAELLCTRLCHDLTGPIGSVNNGAELLNEEGFSMQNEAVSLIVTSALSAVSRLQFYRFAYGRVKDSGEASLSDMRKMATDFFAGSKNQLHWPDEFTDGSGVSASNRFVRLIFNFLMIAAGALLKGGILDVHIADKDGARELIVSAKGTAIKWDLEHAQALYGNISIDHLTPKNIQLYLTHELLAALNMKLKLTEEEGVLTLSALETLATAKA